MRVKIVSPDGKLISPEVKMDDILDVCTDNPADGDILRFSTMRNAWCKAEFPAPSAQYNNRGDPASYDFSKADFSLDGQWHVLSLSGIIPAGVTLVHLSLMVQTPYNAQTIVFCKKGLVNKKNGATVRVPHGAVEYFADAWVVPDANGDIEYWVSNVNWDIFDVLVRGWF